MKITKEHQAVIAEAVRSLDTPERRQQYLAGEYFNAPAQNLDVRYRWDILWLAVEGEGHYDTDRMKSIVYSSNYNNEHLDAALRKIVPPLDEPVIVNPDKLIMVPDCIGMDDA